MTQHSQILEILKQSPNREASCRVFADAYLYHKLATRVSELNAKGYDIRFEKGETTMEGKYRLVSEPLKEPVQMSLFEG